MGKIVYQELRRRYENADFNSMTVEELCQALDVSSIAFNFLHKNNSKEQGEYTFWKNIAARSIAILKSRNISVYFVSSLHDLAQVLLESCHFKESSEYIRRGHLALLPDDKLEELMNILLDSDDARASLALSVISQELQNRT